MGCARCFIIVMMVAVVDIYQVSSRKEIAYDVCYTEGMNAHFRSIQQQSQLQLKWLYYGTTEGVLVNYPGFLWERSLDENCDPSYDPRLQSWFLQAAAGPRNVIILLDISEGQQSEQ
eukprot:8015664-Pyramimonas_sp.AAC.1